MGRDLRGGTSDGSLATVIRQGIKELNGERVPRAAGGSGGRAADGRRTVSKRRRLRQDLERLVEPVTRGDPESPLRWTCKSVRKLAAELEQAATGSVISG